MREIIRVDIRWLPRDQLEMVLHNKSRNIFNFFVRAQSSKRVAMQASLVSRPTDIKECQVEKILNFK